MKRFAFKALVVVMSILYGAVDLSAQSAGYSVSGSVFDGSQRSARLPLPGVIVSIPAYSAYALTDGNGVFLLKNIPAGMTNLTVSMLGKVKIDTMVMVTGDLRLEFYMQDQNFRIQNVVITAVGNKAREATSSLISRSAIDHLQATSLSDVMSLLPGGMTENPDLSYSSQITIRGISNSTSPQFAAASQMNASGVSIIRDGSPMSNNANLQAMSPTVGGATAASGSGAGPAGGVDARTISMENIESVEIIRGIVPVEYGDLLTGAVIINSKAGREPLRISAQTNPNVYAFSAGAGYKLGENSGGLNFNVDYAHNTNSIVQSHVFYERITGKILYSNYFFDNKWRANFAVDLLYNRDVRKQHPDDLAKMLQSNGNRKGAALNANGTVNLDWGWFRNIQYVLSGSYYESDSYYQIENSNAAATYSLTTTDGAILSNRPGVDLYDSNGNRITNFTDVDRDNYATMLDNVYLARYWINSKEVSLFGKVKGTLFKDFGSVRNGIVFGADLKVEGNEGDGKTFSNVSPPHRQTSAPFASFRQRKYKDIPYLNQVGLFLEDNFNLTLGEHTLNIQAGLRYDHVSVAGGVLAPRVSGSFDVLPKRLTLRGGYGITAKMPPLLYLFPEDAYFEYANLNNLALDVPDENKYLVTTTRVFDAQNRNLEISTNTKAELGIDLRWEQYSLAVTAYSEKTQNGYNMGESLSNFQFASFNNYVYNQTTQQIDYVSTRNTILRYFGPTNNIELNTRGLEFILNLGRFDAIRTAFVVDAEWKRSRASSNGYTFNYRTSAGQDYHVGIFDKGMETHHAEKLQTNLRITHNIPQLGFVITLTTEILWKDALWSRFNNAHIPVKYISKDDGQIYDFPLDQISLPEFADITFPDNYYDNSKITLSYPPLLNFNINVTKEIGDWMRVSFFANNMFRSYPIVNNPRQPQSFVKRNKEFFFGLQMSVKIQ